jgi:hypothetical protein
MLQFPGNETKAPNRRAHFAAMPATYERLAVKVKLAKINLRTEFTYIEATC